MLTENLLDSALGLSDGIVALRRAIHAEPELGLHTPKTMAKVRAALADWAGGYARRRQAQRRTTPSCLAARRHGCAADG